MLTAQQQKISKLVLEGLSNEEIAKKTNIKVSTVKFHLTDIYKSNNVKSRHEFLGKNMVAMDRPGFALISNGHIEYLTTLDSTAIRHTVFQLAMRMMGLSIGADISGDTTKEIAKLMGLPTITIWRMAKDFNDPYYVPSLTVAHSSTKVLPKLTKTSKSEIILLPVGTNATK